MLIGLTSLGILDLSALFVSATSQISGSARGAVAVAARPWRSFAATALAVLLLLTVFPHRRTRSVWTTHTHPDPAPWLELSTALTANREEMRDEHRPPFLRGDRAPAA